MILLLHIGIALLSVVFAGYVFFAPSKFKLKISFSLIGFTLASGTYLVVMSPAHMVQACIAGLFYTAVLLIMTLLTQRKLAHLLAAEETVKN